MPMLENDGPPPSTYAAQIVQNLETAKAKPALSGSKFQLKDLFKKVLDLDYHGLIDDDTFERDIGINHKLIWTIVKGCLLLQGNANPFDDQSETVEQAKDGLAVIEVTIRRTPDVLFIVPTGDTSYGRNEGSLFLGLVPLLLFLLRQDNGRGVQDGTRKVLHTMLSLQKKPSLSKFRRLPISTYIRGCVDDILAYLLQLQAQVTSKPVFNLPIVPSIDTVIEACGHDTPGRNCRIEANNTAQALYIALSSIELILKSLGEKSARRDLSTTRWVVDCLSMCFPVFVRLSDDNQSSYEDLSTLLLRILNDVLGRTITAAQNTNETTSVVRLLCQTLAINLELQLRPGGYTPKSELQAIICTSLLLLCSHSKNIYSVWSAYSQYLASTVYRILENKIVLQACEADAQVVLSIIPELISGSLNAFPVDRFCLSNEALRDQFYKLFPNSEPELPASSPPTKRRRISQEYSASSKDIDFRTAYMLAAGIPYDTTTDLPELISNTLAELNEETQLMLINKLGHETCLLAGSVSDNGCAKCNSDCADISTDFLDADQSTTLSDILVCVIRTTQQQKIPKPRVYAMLALRHFFVHCNAVEHMDIRYSCLAPWPLQSLKSKIRSLRIAAVSTVVHLVANNLPRALLRTNRVATLDALRTLSEKDLTLQEISIMAHGRIASIIKSEEEINLCLLRLIGHLGDGNPFVANLAHEELQRLCSHNPHSAMRLFEPYWRTLAAAIIKDLQRRPQICQTVCELLGISISDFLKLTQYHSLPFLIVKKERDILQRIAEANQPDGDLLDVCSGNEQLSTILAHILLQPSEDPANTILTCLSVAHPDFGSADPQEMLRSDPTRVAFELLQIASSTDPDTKARARHGLQILAEKTQRKSSRKYSALQMFFEEMSLGIIQLLSDVINQTKGAQPMSNRRQCIVAIEEMVEIAGIHFSNALPQISSCLRIAMEDPEFCNEAFSAWVMLMNVIDKCDEMGPMLSTTFALVAQYWHFFSTEIQKSASDLIDKIITNHKDWIQENVLSIPSLEGIPLLAKLELDLSNLKARHDPALVLQAFAERCQSDNATVIMQALIELSPYLVKTQDFIHKSVSSEKPDSTIGALIKALLEVCTKFVDTRSEIAADAARCLGLIGCLDPNKIELPSKTHEIFVLSDFLSSDETLEFVIFFLEAVLVKIFLAETDTRNQGLLAYTIQELLRVCGFEPKNTINHNLQPDHLYQRWRTIDEDVRDVLTPFLSSKYSLEPLNQIQPCNYPVYSQGISHAVWLRQLVFDLVGRCTGQNATVVFAILRRIVRRQNISIPAFLLPYISLHVVFQGSVGDMQLLQQEFLHILSTPLPPQQTASENLIACSQDVFRTLDYMSRWLKERKKTRAYLPKVGVVDLEDAQAQEAAKLEVVERFLGRIPADIVSDRAVQCKSFTRALLHWETHIREMLNTPEEDGPTRDEKDEALLKLQQIYNSIDEPDGIQGISSRIVSTTFHQQMLEHRKAGRWSALQSWYEVELNKEPTDSVLQIGFLESLKEVGKYDMLIHEFTSLDINEESRPPITELVAEAAWTSARWDILKRALENLPVNTELRFKAGIGRALLKLQAGERTEAKAIVGRLRSDAIRNLSPNSIKSLQNCHDIMFQLHLLAEIELLEQPGRMVDEHETSDFTKLLSRRVESLGTFPPEQQTLLSTQRAMIKVLHPEAKKLIISRSWLESAKLARKSGFDHQAFHAIFQASDLDDMIYVIEETRMLWREGHRIKAIQNLSAAIESGAFGQPSAKEALEARRKGQAAGRLPQNPVAARAHLLLAKWIDHAGQSQSDAIIEQYRVAIDLHSRSEKGHYYLGRHYNKLLESEKVKPPEKQASSYITGEMTKLVLENFLRSTAMGAKHIHETIPRILTLWLELGSDVKKKVDSTYGNDANFQKQMEKQRGLIFKAASTSMKKYIDRLPAYVFYTALPQVVARICHANDKISTSFVDIVAKVVLNHPQQAMWSLLALIKSNKQADRLQKGKECWSKVQDNAKKLSDDTQRKGIIDLLRQGQRLSEQLLALSEKDLGKRHGTVSLANDLAFNHSKSSHCRLAIPVEAMLTASLPIAEDVRSFKNAFPKDTVTVDTFLDDVLVLNSLVKPKKVSIRGSDGRVYGILCKPKDDLRKDQRLLEFNSMITKLLKRDPQCSKRRLYIKTYAVTPLNEECGLIEWVEGVRPLRDILLDIYRVRNVRPDYTIIKDVLDQINTDKGEIHRFQSEVLKGFPPVFHAWFTEMFPEPNAWFDARLRYTRSSAVMSMVGNVLGLGDRHGENILFQGEHGGIFHVDFNCLFDKGLTFDKPERVPFRLTHNMVDAFGVYGYEGPFRKCCELTMGILRQHEHALMTILETFVYDPTTDFISKKRKNAVVPDTPEGVLEAVRTKVRGLISGESVPLSVEGHVQLLIQEATDHHNLAAMYIGWCAFM